MARFVAWALLALLPGWGAAAGLGRAAAARPAQLTLLFQQPASGLTAAAGASPMAALPFAPRLAATALPQPAAAPQAAPVEAPARAVEQLRTMAALPPSVAQALRGGDSAAFYQACLRTGYAPPPSDDSQQRLLEEGADRAAADAAFLTRRPALAPELKAVGGRVKIDYEEFGRQLRRRGGLSASPFEQVAAKRAVLKAAGYTHLTGRGGGPISIGRAADVRVGLAFANTLKAYKRRP